MGCRWSLCTGLVMSSGLRLPANLLHLLHSTARSISARAAARLTERCTRLANCFPFPFFAYHSPERDAYVVVRPSPHWGVLTARRRKRRPASATALLSHTRTLLTTTRPTTPHGILPPPPPARTPLSFGHCTPQPTYRHIRRRPRLSLPHPVRREHTTANRAPRRPKPSSPTAATAAKQPILDSSSFA